MFRKELKLILFFCIYLFSFSNLYTQTSGPTVPEVMKFEPVDNTDLVNLYTGDFVYTLPIISIPGPEGDYPIALSYHAGIHLTEEASWVGLGFCLQPGNLARMVRGYPDDYNNASTKAEFHGPEYYGFSVTVGYSFISGTVNWRTQEGFGGSVGLHLPIPNEKDLPLGFSANYGTDGFSAGLGLQLESEIKNVTLVNSLGVSFSSKNGVGFGHSFSVEGAAFTMSRSEGYKYDSINIPIPFLSSKLWINIGGHHAWLNEPLDEHAYGYLYVDKWWEDTEGMSRIDWKPYKAEYYREKSSGYHDGYIEPSQDNYIVTGQGLTGRIVPYRTVYYDVAATDFFSNFFGFNGFDLSFDEDGSNGEVIFRFPGDLGGGFITDNSYDLDLKTSEYNPGNPFSINSRKISYICETDQSSNIEGAITDFSITESDGSIYEYSLPVYNNYQYSKGFDSDDSGKNSCSHYYTPFAYTWLLTAIKGPDYVDINNNGIDDEDFGYWVRFNYKKIHSNYSWRSPASGSNPSGIIKKNENFKLDRQVSCGNKEIYYLNNIETATHVAYFITDDRDDSHEILADQTIGSNTMKLLDEIQLYRKIDWNDSNLDGFIDANEVNTTNSIKSIDFVYSYDLCKGTPNSDADNDGYGDLDSDGKLTLESITFYGKGKTINIPPYSFDYNSNPDYLNCNYDKWGNYKSDGTDLEHLIIENSSNDAIAWSLNEITLPTGGKINISYENDDYSFVRDQKPRKPYDKHSDYEFIGQYNDGIYCYGDDRIYSMNIWVSHDAAYEIDDKVIFKHIISGGLEVTDNIPATVTKKWPLYNPSTHPNQDIITVECLQYNNAEYSIGGVSEIFAIDNTIEINEKAGGGIRVKEITFTSNLESYCTKYFYDVLGDGTGSSSGVATNEPPPYGIKEDRIDAFKQEKGGNIISPSAMVGYSKVTIVNYGKNITNDYGKTEYSFYTAKDFPFEYKIDYSLDANQGGTLSYLTKDYSSIYGKLKSEKKYDKTSNIISSAEYLYRFSNGLLSDASNVNEDPTGINILKPDESTIQKKIGINYQRFGKNIVNTGNYGDSYVGSSHVNFNVYLEDVIQSLDNVTTSTHNDYFDLYSGKVIQKHTKVSNGNIHYDQIIPAYWKFSCNFIYDPNDNDMFDRNMLNQICQKKKYLNSIIDGNILRSSITTWSNQFDIDGDNTISTDEAYIWRKNDKYIYNKKIDGATFSDFEWELTDNNGNGIIDYSCPGLAVDRPYPSVSETYPWKMISNITRYDRYSHPIEESHQDGTYSCAIYGYNSSVPISVISNAELSQVQYIDFENDNSSNITNIGYGKTGERAIMAKDRDWSNEYYFTLNLPFPLHKIKKTTLLGQRDFRR